MSVKDDVYFSFQDEAIRRVLSKLLEKAKAFLNPDYGLKKRNRRAIPKVAWSSIYYGPRFQEYNNTNGRDLMYLATLRQIDMSDDRQQLDQVENSPM